MSEVKNIPEGWTKSTLGEACSKIGSGSTPTGGAEAYKKDGISLIRSQNIHDFNFSYQGLAFIDNSQAKKLAGVTVVSKDILLNITGDSVARACMVPDKVLPARVNQHVAILRADMKKIDSFFLKYLILNPVCKSQLLMIASSGATRNALTKTMLERFEILLPSYDEQRSIASILTSFDDKIELLQAQNKTLEETAQTIFKEWFGKYKVDDELPEGWRIGNLGEEFNITIGRTPPRLEQEWFSKTPIGKKWISIKDIGNSGTFIFNTSEFLTDEAIKKFNIPIIPKNTTILSFKMTVGKLVITTEEMLSNEAIAHLKVKSDSSLSSEYIYLYLQNLDFNSLGSTSSIVTAINSTMIKAIGFVIPNKEFLMNFDIMIKPLFNKIKFNIEQVQTLIQTRDELLPKLMSGEIRVKKTND
ncbi:restriction endonuclease subunit S [Chryseobacterium capnotolerans]|uniref:restriction endonuclease subunit S n=1 Tax=Chryseobacterium TaxID=59732 RepID=UPI00083B259E|nr:MULTISPECIES: restriction endonuclease subunit S [Chryseobacterium]UHO39891.1 restriction endonuclease subunit S [Chryseobacterium capnotolerans]